MKQQWQVKQSGSSFWTNVPEHLVNNFRVCGFEVRGVAV